MALFAAGLFLVASGHPVLALIVWLIYLLEKESNA